MSAVASKNLYELLGNDHDEDSDKEPEPPVKVVDKTPARTTKRNASGEAPTKAPVANGGGRGGRRGGHAGNDGAFRDRDAGSANNQSKPTDEAYGQDREHRGGRGGRGGGRGGRGGRNFDRHSRTVGGESEKQASHAWGAVDGGAELADEQAGEWMASVEKNAGDGDAAPADSWLSEPVAAVDSWVTEPATEPVVEAEPEDNSISYADYLAQLAEKKLALGTGIPEPRAPVTTDKKWASAVPLSKDDEEDFVAGSGGKAKRERAREAKKIQLDIEHAFVEAPDRAGGRGGGRGRGDGSFRGRGEGRRGDGSFRARGEGGRGEGGHGDGSFRARGEGGRGRGDGSFRARGEGGRARDNFRSGAPRFGDRASSDAPNTDDPDAFPSLGA